MPIFAISVFAAALSLGVDRNDWVQASGSSGCDATDVDFSDALHGFATCTLSAAMTSDDGGLSWRVFNTGLQQSLLYAHAESPDELYAARLGFYRSDDGGDSWSERGGLSVGGGGSVFDVAFLAEGRRVAIQGGALLLSTDEGESWDVRYPGEFGVYFDELHFPTSMIGFASGGNTTEGGSSGSLARTDDGGATWTLVPFTYGEITAADFIDALHGVVATQSARFYTTADGGTSWQRLGDVPDGGILLDLAHRDAQHWYGVSIEGCLYETRNAGTTWTTGFCDPDGNALVALSARGNAVVAVGSAGLVLYENRLLRDGFDG